MAGIRNKRKKNTDLFETPETAALASVGEGTVNCSRERREGMHWEGQGPLQTAFFLQKC